MTAQRSAQVNDNGDILVVIGVENKGRYDHFILTTQSLRKAEASDVRVLANQNMV